MGHGCHSHYLDGHFFFSFWSKAGLPPAYFSKEREVEEGQQVRFFKGGSICGVRSSQLTSCAVSARSLLSILCPPVISPFIIIQISSIYHRAASKSNKQEEKRLLNVPKGVHGTHTLSCIHQHTCSTPLLYVIRSCVFNVYLNMCLPIASSTLYSFRLLHRPLHTPTRAALFFPSWCS